MRPARICFPTRPRTCSATWKWSNVSICTATSNRSSSCSSSMKKSDHSMRVRPPSRSRRAAVAGPLAAALVVACFCGTSPEEAQLFSQRRQRIAGLTHTEVEQLKRNYEEFRKLPPDRRKALEELNDEVKQDTSGRLLKLLAGYNRWFSG